MRERVCDALLSATTRCPQASARGAFERDLGLRKLLRSPAPTPHDRSPHRQWRACTPRGPDSERVGSGPVTRCPAPRARLSFHDASRHHTPPAHHCATVAQGGDAAAAMRPVHLVVRRVTHLTTNHGTDAGRQPSQTSHPLPKPGADEPSPHGGRRWGSTGACAVAWVSVRPQGEHLAGADELLPRTSVSGKGPQRRGPDPGSSVCRGLVNGRPPRLPGGD